MKTISLLALVLVLNDLATAAVDKPYELPTARLTIKTVHENGEPVSGVRVKHAFLDPVSRSPAPVEGLTDAQGLFVSQGSCASVLGGRIQKDGYYDGGFPFTPYLEAKDGKWQPWDVIYTSVMRRIENPIPMYARKVFLHVPQVGKPCGFDLKECDWVAPWGKGLVPDFVFTLNCAYTNFNHQDVSMKLTFSNPLDGIQPANLPKEYAYSTFIWHRQAPETGYLDNYQMEFGLPDKGFKIPDVSKIRAVEEVEALKYYFRVRTIVKDGQIVSALYGKLSQGFFIGAMSSTDVNVRTCYYLNPKPLDRNMEFDLKQNLFKNLKFAEQPRKP